MSEIGLGLPAVIVTGMNRKIKAAFENTVDGHPASLGMPMEYEVKHYYNYFICHENITFDAFLSLLAQATARRFPNLDFTLAWVRQCDALSNVRSARRCLHHLRTYVNGRGHYSVSFWDLLWRLKEIYVKSFGMTYAEIGTTPHEIERLSWQFLLKECTLRVRDLRRKSRNPASMATREAFIIVDKMLEGTPLPYDVFCQNRRTHYSSGGPYDLYRDTAEGRVIPPEDVSWSLAEHQAIKTMLFPEGYQEKAKKTNTTDPTAPATIGNSDCEIWRLSPIDPTGVQTAGVSRNRALKRRRRQQILSNVVWKTMRTLPLMERQVAH